MSCRNIELSISYKNHLLQYNCIRLGTALEIRLTRAVGEAVQISLLLEDTKRANPTSPLFIKRKPDKKMYVHDYSELYS